ncbi:hypothetical protein N8I74_14185 [Chitiniphilus purpureus]|uniref:Uncharacterized protein n=1 Tax=Chitiniphilus purpureus TaxID=2981137 RepID=A0ABY6DLV3_9NEIS|nr:hypothetical protein [Chitiniphilus sp. CD1]UXY14456.1 hypothetical protein N8I74_14185 [Chitiniphilus sp. CD1]
MGSALPISKATIRSAGSRQASGREPACIVIPCSRITAAHIPTLRFEATSGIYLSGFSEKPAGARHCGFTDCRHPKPDVANHGGMSSTARCRP